MAFTKSDLRATARQVGVAVALALLGPLPSPHLDGYWPVAVGLFFSILAVPTDGPEYLLAMIALITAYAVVTFLALTVLAYVRGRRSPAAKH